MNDVEVGESPSEGLGVFATRNYTAGQRIRRVHIVREVTEATPLRREAGERIEHCAYPNGKVVLWGFPDRHVNHSCDPNAYGLDDGGSVSVVARRAIPAGEEMTFDYNLNLAGDSSWPCNCGVAPCLGETVADYFSLPEERQMEYLPLLADWFVRRHRERIDALRLRASRRR